MGRPNSKLARKGAFSLFCRPGSPGARFTRQKDVSFHVAKFSFAPSNLRALRSNNDEFQTQDVAEEHGLEGTPDHLVGFIEVDPHEPLVLHSLEDQESSASHTPCKVSVIDGEGTSGAAARATTDPTHTPAQHINTVNSILRESPFESALHPNGDQWVQRLRSTMANLNSAFAAVIEPPAQNSPPLSTREEEVHDHVNI
jgi:hypothetical protein